MNLWKTVGLLVVFLGVLGYALKYERGEPPDPEADRQLVALLGFDDADDVAEIEVQGLNQSFTLTRTAKADDAAADAETPAAEDKADWKLTAPFEAALDQTAVDSYVQSLLTSKASQYYTPEMLEESELDDSLTGLNEPSATLTLKGDDGHTATILFGDKSPGNNGYYAQVKGEAAIPIFPVWFVDDSIRTKDLGTLRAKDLLAVASADVQRITLKYPAETIRVEREGDGWRMKAGNRTLPADASAIESLLSSLSSARIDTFVDRDPKDLEAFGLTDPRIEVVLSLGSKGEQGLLIGDTKAEPAPPPPSPEMGEPPPPEEKLFVQRKGDTEVVTVPSTVYDALLLTVDDLRDKTVLAFTPEQATAAEWTWDGKTIKLAKQPETERGLPVWQLVEPEQMKADAEKIDRFLEAVDMLRATGFVDEPGDLAQYGLAEPRGRIAVTTGKDEHVLLIGKQAGDGSGLYVMPEGSEIVLKVRSSFDQDIETNLNRLRDLTVLAFDRQEVQKIALRRDSGDLVVLERTAGEGGEEGWKVTKPEQQEADPGRVGAVLTALEALHADELVTEKADNLADYNLKKPEVIATLTMKDGTTHTLYASIDPEQGVAAYLKLKGDDAIYKTDTGIIVSDLQKGPSDFEPLPEPEMPMGPMSF